MDEPGLISTLIPLILLGALYWVFIGRRRPTMRSGFGEPTRELFQGKADWSDRLVRPGIGFGWSWGLALLILLFAAAIALAAAYRWILQSSVFVPFELVLFVANALAVAVAISGGRFSLIGKAPSINGTILWLNRWGTVGFAGALGYLQVENALRAYRLRERHHFFDLEVHPFYFAAAAILIIGGIIALLRVLRAEEEP